MYRKLMSLFQGRTDNTLLQLFRYTLVGGLAFLVDYSSLFLLTEFGSLHYLWAAAVAFILGLMTNYCLSISWVFGTRTVQNRQTEFIIFAVLGVLGLGINEAAMYLLTSVAGLHYLVSKVVSTVVTYGWNFLSRKALLFSIPAEAAETSEPAVTWQPAPRPEA